MILAPVYVSARFAPERFAAAVARAPGEKPAELNLEPLDGRVWHVPVV